MEHVQFRWRPGVTERTPLPGPTLGQGSAWAFPAKSNRARKSLARDADAADDLMRQGDGGGACQPQNRTEVKYPWVISVLPRISLWWPVASPPSPVPHAASTLPQLPERQNANVLLYDKTATPGATQLKSVIQTPQHSRPPSSCVSR